MIFHVFICILHHLRVCYKLIMRPAPSWLYSSVGRALHRYRRGQWVRTPFRPEVFLKSWYTNLEQTLRNLTDANNYQRLINDLCTTKTKPTSGLLTDRLNFDLQYTGLKPTNWTNKRWIETDQWPMTNSKRVFQPIPSWHNWPTAFNRPDF